MINISKYSINTPEYKVAQYLNSLERRAFTKMCNYIQKHFLNVHEGKGVFKFSSVPSYLKNDLYKYLDFIKAEILERKEIEEFDNNIIVDVVVKMTYFELRGPKKKVTRKHVFRLVKEDKDGNPSIHGTWGVNPLSTMRFIDG